MWAWRTNAAGSSRDATAPGRTSAKVASSIVYFCWATPFTRTGCPLSSRTGVWATRAGMIWPGAAAAVTSSPPITSDSLLARASALPAARAARVGSSPAAPVMAFITTSQGRAASRWEASGPAQTAVCAGNRSASAAAASADGTATTSGVQACAWSTNRSRLPPPADSPTTRKRSGWASITSRVWVPIEPVDPSRTTSRTGQGYRGCRTALPLSRHRSK